MRTYIVSPSASGIGTAQTFLQYISDDHVALMGYEDGSSFFDIQAGDLVIIARGANWKKECYYAGLASPQPSYQVDVDGKKSARKLIGFVDLHQVQVPFSTECTGGESRNPHGACCALSPDNAADAAVIGVVSKKVFEQLEVEMMNSRIKLMESNKNLILTGAPGTGKTYTARKIAQALVLGEGSIPSEESDLQERQRRNLEAQRKIVQFHPGYDYSDFVIGLKPVLGKDGSSVSYEWKPGVFKVFADQAKKAYDEAVGNNMTPPKYVMIIDEINRADLSRVFGELFSLIEADYRYRRDGEKVINGEGVVLPNGERFVIPDNLYIIGTMNDIDRSVESMDFALRRRFAWHEINAKDSESSILDACIGDEALRNTVKMKMATINQYLGDYGGVPQKEIEFKDRRKIKLPLGAEYQLGGAYFRKIKDMSGFAAAWENGISVILSEYLRGMRDKDAVLEFIKSQYENAGK